MSITISGKEVHRVFLWSLLIVGLTCLPYLYAYLVTPDGMQFTGLLSNPMDGNSYLAKMRQGAQGSWLFHLPYTSEDHDGALIFTYYLFLGRLSAPLGLPLILTYHLARIVNGLILLFVACWFFSLLNLDRWSRHATFLLLALSSGSGWLAIPFNVFAPDLWVPEAITFYAILANPHFPLAVALMLLTFAFVIAPIRGADRPSLPGEAATQVPAASGGGMTAAAQAPTAGGDRVTANPRSPSLGRPSQTPGFAGGLSLGTPSSARGLALAALSSLLLGIVQPFCVITVYSVLGGYFLLRFLKDRRLPWSEILRGMVAGALTAPVIAYDYYVYTFNSVLRAWSEQNVTPSPPLWTYAVAYGFVLILAVGGTVLATRRQSQADLFLLAWVIVNGLLLYAPFSLQRRLVTGLHIPLCILAGMALSRYVLPRFSPARRTLILGAVLVLTVPSNLVVVATLMAGAARHDSRLYLYQDEMEAMTWLRENTRPTDIVLASPEMGLFIPAWAGNRVLYGHPFETIQAKEKKALVEEFFQEGIGGQAGREIVRLYRPAYLFYGPRERELGELEHEMLPVVYQNRSVTILTITIQTVTIRPQANGWSSPTFLLLRR